MSPFKPLGDQPRWRILYDLLVCADVGDLITYQQMGDALGLDPMRQRSHMVGPMRRAATEYAEVDKRAIEVVRDEGYRVVDVDGHLRLARAHGRRAGTQLELGYSTVTNVDLSGVDPEVRKGLEVLARGFGQQMEINRRITARQRRTEKALETVVLRSERTDEELASLRERLAALEDRNQSS